MRLLSPHPPKVGTRRQSYQDVFSVCRIRREFKARSFIDLASSLPLPVSDGFVVCLRPDSQLGSGCCLCLDTRAGKAFAINYRY